MKGEVRYRDGFRKWNFAGAGVYRERGHYGIIILSEDTHTIMQAELVGIQVAAQLAVQDAIEEYICSDSGRKK